MQAQQPPLQVKNYTDNNFFDNVIPPNSQQIFTSVYPNFTGNVFSSSDIHGDIHAFIIQLRDCAGVIHSSNGFNPLSGTVDPNIDNNLNMNIRDNDTVGGATYDPSLGYRWCGGDSLYVICGDIIDSCRGGLSYCRKTPNGDPCHFYPQSEIKLLRFINAINESARNSGVTGKIIKLLGNHDYYNTMYCPGYPNAYIPYMGHPDDRAPANYYRGISRLEVFLPGNIGFSYLFDGQPGYGCGAFVMINDTVYCHGQITEHADCTLYNLINTNDFLNADPFIAGGAGIAAAAGAPANVLHQDWDMTQIRNQSGQIQNNVWVVLGVILQVRTWAHVKFDNVQQNTLCNNSKDPNGVDSVFRSFMKQFPSVVGHMPIGTLPAWIPNLRLVVGHTPQLEKSITGMFTHLVKEDSQTQTYGIYNGGNLVTATANGVVDGTADITSPGITGVCIKDNQVDFKIICVDNSISRGFDAGYNVDSHKRERDVLYRRTPQVLKIDYKNPISAVSIAHPQGVEQFTNISIVRSKMKNTRIHQPRTTYENEVGQYPALALNNARYNTKYLKYKTKYLKLKRMNL